MTWGNEATLENLAKVCAVFGSITLFEYLSMAGLIVFESAGGWREEAGMGRSASGGYVFPGGRSDPDILAFR
jgi:hypothetical protein